MDNLNKNQSAFNKDHGRKDGACMTDAASELLNEGKKYANELYKEGLNKVSEAEDSVKEYSDDLLKKVQENPLASVLIAAGVGFLLSALLKK